MDCSPIDLEALARMVNELFRGGDADTGMTTIGATDVRTALSVGAAAVDPETAQSGAGTAQGPDGFASEVSHSPGFDMRTIPGFAPIPNVDDGFDVSSLLGASAAQARSVDRDTRGIDPAAAGAAAPGASAVPSQFLAAPHGLYPLGAQPGVPAGGATVSPSALSGRPAFGRAISAEPPVVGYGHGQPPTGTTPAPQIQSAGIPRPALERHDGQIRGLGRLESLLPQAPHDFDFAELDETGLHYLAPTNLPGLAAAPGAATGYTNASSRSTPTQVPGASRRSIDRPTPNAFAFTDAPHLGEFDEQEILRRSLDPQNGAPAIEGLRDRSTPLPDPTANQFLPSATPSFYVLDDRMDYFADDVPDVPRPTAIPFNAEAVRRDFPVLHQTVNGHPLVWLDNGATTQKPQAVIDRISRFYETENSNISRSAHELAARATNAYEDARKSVQRFINASEVEEIVFVRGTTEGINLVAQSFGRRFIKEGDEIVLTHAEHHANIVPWYNLAQEVGAHLKVVPFDDNGEILLDEYEQLLNHRVKIVATTHVANALGSILPVKAMTEMAHRHGIPVLVDGAQSISHMPIDVQDIDCDFYVFSGHKVFAPTGIGALYGKKALLDQMPPWQGGGNMIKDVTFEKITFQPAPFRFEAGTGNIADAVGLAEALKYLERLGMTNIEQYEHALLDYATQKLAPIKGLTIIGKAREKAGVISFLLEGKEQIEVGKALNEKGIAVRAGHHCALPILRRYGVQATVRPAFAIYNTYEDADRLAEAVREIAAN